MYAMSESTRIPARPTLDGIEARWGKVWADQGTYAFDRSQPRSAVFAIDTPPPTVSGSLHVGHVFSFTQTDLIARYQRMRGRAVFYPMGWDDNGLPTERRVQLHFGVQCDPSLPYDPSFTPPETPPDPPLHISRRNFVELCHRQTELDEQAFEEVWRRVGLSVDWSMLYTTIGDRARATAQQGFLNNLDGGEASAVDGPTLWDITFAPPSPRPSWRTVSGRGPTTGCGSARSSSRRRGPSCCRPVWRWSRTRATRGSRRCSAPRCARRCSTSRSRCWRTRWPTRRRAPASSWSARSAT